MIGNYFFFVDGCLFNVWIKMVFEILNGVYIKLLIEISLFVYKSWRIFLKYCIFVFGWIIDWSFILYYGYWKFNLVKDKDVYVCI